MTRFNITRGEIGGWMTRLLSQATFISKQENSREKYRLNDIVVIVDTHQKAVVTVYSQNEHDDIAVQSRTNPEVKSVINDALRTMIKRKKVKTAMKIHDSLAKMLEVDNRMNKPHTNYRFTDNAWEDLIDEFNEIKSTIDSSLTVIEESQAKIEEK